VPRGNAARCFLVYYLKSAPVPFICRLIACLLVQGLIKVVAQVFPESEHRFCVRHMYSNFQQLFKCENLKNQLWTCVRSTTMVQFNKNMEKMRVLNEKAFNWLEKNAP
jgi:hypothetical protein